MIAAVVRLVTFLGLAALASCTDWEWSQETPLDAYVNMDDPSYSYEEIDTIIGDGYTVHVLNMTSQTWFDETLTTNPVWFHYLAIVIPDDVIFTDAAYIVIGSGNNPDAPPTELDTRLNTQVAFALDTGAVTAYLKMVPNQPVYFVEDPRERVEDFIIGYTWRLFIEAEGDPDPFLILQLPMVKAAKLALDTMTEFVQEKRPEIELTRFMTHGYSKRGWVSWLLGCVDPRIFAMAPTVLDLLNFQPNLVHHYRSYGGWSWAFFPYWSEGVARYLYNPRTRMIGDITDPLAYNPRLTMPKLIITGAGDEFFLPDGSHYFLEELNGSNYMQIWENDDHGLGDHRPQIEESLRSFFLATVNNYNLPNVRWSRGENEYTGYIAVECSERPVDIKAWMADTTEAVCEDLGQGEVCRRDFRILTVEGYSGVTWSDFEVEDLGDGRYYVEFDKREDLGFRGFFIEMTFEGPDGRRFRVTTEVNIIPDEFPYPECTSEMECQGRIV